MIHGQVCAIRRVQKPSHTILFSLGSGGRIIPSLRITPLCFQQNRAKYAQLAPAPKAPAKQASEANPHDDDTVSKIRLSFQTRFVRLNGIFFTKTSVETFSDVYTATMSDLDALFEADDVALDMGLAAERRSGISPGSAGAAGLLQVGPLSRSSLGYPIVVL